MSWNQEIVAQMRAQHAIANARLGPQPSSQARLMLALEEAISDARRRREKLGVVGSEEYLQINAQIARWEAAWRYNR
ncbi:hypothetical protein ACTOWA_00525 [Herbaspirillum seropedicae]|uniref:hypothetical protein n=1 Tax=Herbaspirillum seropedicae TaxID=964 RepID=UPI002858A233|nr:hypothetical protein [Herbaspirillum seropedicae]MDR6397922.1 hypothetical protein [Herbaspirillum seropedicae]